MNSIVILLGGLCMGLASVACLIGAVWTYFNQKRKVEGRQPATGTVVELVYHSRGGRGGVYCPVVEYTTTSGQAVKFTSNFGSRPAMHRVGQSVEVRYDPTEPEKAEINSKVTQWLTPAILALMALIGCCLSAGALGIYAMYISTASF